MEQPGASSLEPPSHQGVAVLVPHQCHAGAGYCSPLPVTAMWSHATWAEVQPVPFPGAQVIGTLFYALMPRYPQTRAAPMSGSGQRLRCGAVWDGTWPLHCFVLMAPEPGGSPALLQGQCQGNQARLAAVMMAAVSGQQHLLGSHQEGLELGLSWERGSSERPQSWRGQRDHPKFREWGMQLRPGPGPAALGWGCFSPAGTEGLSHVPPWCLGPGSPAVMYCKYSVCHLLLWDPWQGQG